MFSKMILKRTEETTMGWANCGTDSEGRPIGYAHEGKCDYGCGNAIDRGLSYACGEMHGQLEYGCEGYFCPEHLFMACVAPGEYRWLCQNCYDEMEAMSEANHFVGTIMEDHANEKKHDLALKEVFSKFRECPEEIPAILESVMTVLYEMPTELVVAFGMASHRELGKDNDSRREFCEVVLEHFDHTEMHKEQVRGIFEDGRRKTE